MEIRDYRSALDDPASRKHGTFSYLPPMDDTRLRRLVDYVVGRGWSPAVEHVEADRAGDDYWYMWKLPLFGEGDADRILAEVAACRRRHADHLVRLIGYDRINQSQGTAVVLPPLGAAPQATAG